MAIQIGRYGLRYKLRRATKAQALADFITECSFNEISSKERQSGEKPSYALDFSSSIHSYHIWNLCTNGSCSARRVRAWIVLKKGLHMSSY